MATSERAKPGAFRFGTKAQDRPKGGKSGIADTVSAYALWAAGVSGIVAVSPFLADAHQYPKYAAFAALTAVSGIAWAIGRLRGGELKVGKMAWMPALALVTTAIVALFSFGWSAWLAGPDRQPLSFATAFSLAVFVFLGWQHLDDGSIGKVRDVAVAIIAALMAFFLARTFLPLPPFFPGVGLSLVSASAVDTAILAAVGATIALGSLFEDGNGTVRRVAYGVATAIGLAALVLIGTPRAWAAASIGLLGVFYLMVRSAGWKDWRTVVAALALALSLPLSVWGTPPAARLAIPPEIRLGVADSFRVAGTGLSSGIKRAIFGAGLGAYPKAFGENRPEWLNATDAYSAVSVQPYGSLPFAFAEGGVTFGLAVLVLVLATLAYSGMALLGIARESGKAGAAPKRLTESWAPIALGMIAFEALFGVPSFVLLLSAAVAFLALSVSGRSSSRRLVGSVGWSVAAILVLSLFLGFTVRAAVAQCYFGRALAAFSTGGTERSLALVSFAERVEPDPRHTLGIAQARTKLAAGSPDDETLRAAAIQALRSSERNRMDTIDYEVTLGNTAAQLAAASPEEVGPIVRQAVMAAVAASPSNPALRLWAGDMYFAVGDKATASSEYEQAIALRSGFTQALVHYAQLLSVPGDGEDRDRALELMKQAYVSSPQSKDVLGMLVAAAVERGKPEDIDLALTALLAYLRSYPEDTQAISAYAGIAADHGRIEDAKAAYEKLLELVPDNADAKAAYDRLGAATSTSSGR